MDNTAPEGLTEHISKLDDPRVDRNKKHELVGCNFLLMVEDS